jgi:hypothetical protein
MTGCDIENFMPTSFEKKLGTDLFGNRYGPIFKKVRTFLKRGTGLFQKRLITSISRDTVPILYKSDALPRECQPLPQVVE